MAYTALFDKDAAKYIKSLDATTRNRFKAKLDLILVDPFDAAHSKPLKMRTERTARVGDYRILFEVDTDNKLVHIVAAGPRGQIYR